MQKHGKQPAHSGGAGKLSQARTAPELLAPAGQVESFLAAVENGASAVYLGLKRLSARATATNFTLDELATLVPYAHKRSVGVYIALNSAVTAPEFPAVLDLLQALASLQVDALIVQDPGIFFLARKYFPQLRLHASTLMAVHNHAGVNQLQSMGARRVVLARELTLAEIGQIAERSSAELEIFVHGALCYSYSGLCLASSYRGGHGGLQGRCVQPCRLKFQQGRKDGYFLSCNDFCALPLIPELKKLRLAAFKIEGRMKSADYIAQVVKAYRLVMDAPPERAQDAVAQAQEWLAQSPSRRLTKGFLGDSPHAEVLTPHRSGSSGLWVGVIRAFQGKRMVVALRHDLRIGDRLRPESKEGKEKDAFTVSEILSLDGKPLTAGATGETVLISSPGHFLPEERLFKVGTRTRSSSSAWQIVRRDIHEAASFTGAFPHKEAVRKDLPVAPAYLQRSEENLILKVGLMQDVFEAFQSSARWVMFPATRSNLEKVARLRFIPAQKARFVWSIPPLLAEKEIEYYRAAVTWFNEKGFTTWEINNWGHLDLFPGQGRSKATLIAGHRLNMRNAAASAALAEAGCQWSVFSLEITREELQILGRAPLSTIPIVTVYAWPPLFTSRLIPKLLEEKPILTPRKEVHFFRKKGEYSFIYADRPMNWLGELDFLRSLGLRSFMLDLSDGPRDQAGDIARLLNDYKRAQAAEPYSLFNLDRRPTP